MRLVRVTVVLLVLLSATCANAQTQLSAKKSDSEKAGVIDAITAGDQALFNGKDLTGWSILPTTEAQKKSRAGWQKNDSDAPPWPIVESKVNFDGKVKSDDGRFLVEKEALVVSVPPEGRKVQMLYSDAVVEGDFELRLEFRASENADSGVFIRGKQLQCRDYLNAGPYRNLKKFKSDDWNELVVVVTGETARCTCNGEVLEEKFKVPTRGPIGVEADRGKFEFRNIRIRQSANNMLKPTNEVSAWDMERFEGGKATVQADGEAIVFETFGLGEKVWDVQAYQKGLDFEEDAEYRVSFEIKADRNDVQVDVFASINESDWHNVGLYEEISVTKEFKKYEFTFWASDVVKDKNRIGFVLGFQTATVTVANFSLGREKE